MQTKFNIRLWLGLLLFLSGVSSLIYQVAWQRILGIYYGVGPVSTAVIVSIFMLGLGMGSLIGGRLAKFRHISLGLYIGLELGIGFFGVASLSILDALGAATAGADLWLTIVCTSAFLFIPTFMMGATLPIVIHFFSSYEKRILTNVSYLYFINTLGAGVGALIGSYFAITFLGLDGAIYLASSLNFVLALTAILLSRKYFYKIYTKVPTNNLIEGKKKLQLLFIFFVAGFLAIGYQIIWYRIIGVILKDSPYSFASILSIYLFSIAFGSWWIEKKSIKLDALSQRDLYYKLNFFISISSLAFIGLYLLSSQFWPLGDLVNLIQQQMILPFRPTEPVLFVISFLPVLLVPLFFLGVPGFLMGASFPLATALLDGKRGGEPGSNMAISYFFTIIGNTLGGLVTGFILLPYLGTNITLVVFGFIAIIFFSLFTKASYSGKKIISVLFFFALVVLIFSPKNWIYSKLHMRQEQVGYSYFSEGVEGVVLARSITPHIYNFINGSLHGAYPGAGYFNSAFLALSTLKKDAISVLIIGYGAGSITEAILIDPRVKGIRLVEINHTLLDNFKNFNPQKDVLESKRLKIIIDDARRDLMRSNEKFDLIMMDPLRSSSQLSNNIYSQEFLELLHKRLQKDGVLMIWTDSNTVLPRTVGAVFPYVDFYREQCSFMLASDHLLVKDIALYNALISASPEIIQTDILNSKCKVPSENLEGILSRTKGIPINTDKRPISEYYLRGYK